MSEDLIRRSDAIKAIASLHILADEEKIFKVYADNPHSMTTDFEKTLIDAINAIKSIPTIEPKAKVIAQVTFDEEKLREIVKEAVECFKEEYEITDRPQGEWIVHKERTGVNDGFIDFFPTEYECSNCGLKQSMYFINSKPSNFCPNCGADMRGKDDEVR